jgi:hypothetical protein
VLCGIVPQGVSRSTSNIKEKKNVEGKFILEKDKLKELHNFGENLDLFFIMWHTSKQ